MRTPSSFGLVGSPPQLGGIRSRAVIILSCSSSIWMVQVFDGPERKLRTLGLDGGRPSTSEYPTTRTCLAAAPLGVPLLGCASAAATKTDPAARTVMIEV